MKKSIVRFYYNGKLGSSLWHSSKLTSKNPGDTEGQKALNELKLLCEEKKFREVLEKIPAIEENFPSCFKAVTYYRGLAKYEIRKENGDLPQLTHMKT